MADQVLIARAGFAVHHDREPGLARVGLVAESAPIGAEGEVLDGVLHVHFLAVDHHAVPCHLLDADEKRALVVGPGAGVAQISGSSIRGDDQVVETGATDDIGPRRSGHAVDHHHTGGPAPADVGVVLPVAADDEPGDGTLRGR